MITASDVSSFHELDHLFMRFWCAILAATTLPGCVVVQVGVTNPVEGISTVAVVPFFNLSQEPTADGRRVAAAYFAELQKVPGFQVLPVGVAEQAIRDHGLELSDPADALALARLLEVDAVVIGAVTDYDPYYPPRIGLQVAWYSPKPVAFVPGVPTDPHAREAFDEAFGSEWKLWRRVAGSSGRPVRQFRAQTPEGMGASDGPLEPGRQTAGEFSRCGPKPFMAYTRLFDGADANLTAALRDYLELNGDLRSGGWEASLYRSEDFLRFTSHLMIVEMLTLHGGDTRRRIVFTHRKYR